MAEKATAGFRVMMLVVERQTLQVSVVEQGWM